MDTTDTTFYRKPTLFICYIVLLKTKKVCEAQYSWAQCVGHNTLQGQPAVTEQSNWDGTMEIYCSAVKDTLIQTKNNQLSEAFIGNEEKMTL